MYTLGSNQLRQERNGKLTLDGPQMMLVSRRSATCGFFDTCTNVTFPIHANHSNMVKFKKSSDDCNIVLRRLAEIQQGAYKSQSDIESGAHGRASPHTVPEEVGQPADQENSQHGTGPPAGNLTALPARSIRGRKAPLPVMDSITDNLL
jgi:hypothetical protein